MTAARALAALAVLAGVASAEPAKSRRKAAPDKFAKAAGEAFSAAVAADNAGDLRAAAGLYQKAQAISPHPSTVYNLADVQRRLGALRAAIKSYELYLAMAPDAKDRRDVEALVEQLARTPGKLVVITSGAADPNAVDLAAAYLFVDGKLARRPGPIGNVPHRGMPGTVLEVPPGERIVDAVTALSYAWRRCEVGPGEQRECDLRAEPRIDGNVVISAASRQIDVLPDRRSKSLVYRRSELPTGRHRLLVRDRRFGCAPLALEVPGGDTVTYAFLGTSEYEYKRCRALDIERHQLQFAP